MLMLSSSLFRRCKRVYYFYCNSSVILIPHYSFLSKLHSSGNVSAKFSKQYWSILDSSTSEFRYVSLKQEAPKALASV